MLSTKSLRYTKTVYIILYPVSLMYIGRSVLEENVIDGGKI